MIGGYCIFRVGMLFAGVYLSLEEVASYGLMMQLSGIITSVSQNYYIVKQPEIASYKVRGDKNKLTEIFSFSIFINGGNWLIVCCFLWSISFEYDSL